MVGEQACQGALTRSEHSSTLAPVRGPGGLLEGSQRVVALEALGKSGSSFGPKVVHRQTAGVWGAEVRLSGVNGR